MASSAEEADAVAVRVALDEEEDAADNDTIIDRSATSSAAAAAAAAAPSASSSKAAADDDDDDDGAAANGGGGGGDEDDDEVGTCAICWDDLDPVTSRLTPCGHVFCEACLGRLLLSGDQLGPSGLLGFADGRCPMCRTYVQHSDLLPVPSKGQLAAQQAALDAGRSAAVFFDAEGNPVAAGPAAAGAGAAAGGVPGAAHDEGSALLSGPPSSSSSSSSSKRASKRSSRRSSSKRSSSKRQQDPTSSVTGYGGAAAAAAAAVAGGAPAGPNTTAEAVDVVEAVVRSGRGAGVRVAAAAQWPSALPFISKDAANLHAVTAAVPRAWIAMEFGQTLRIQPHSFTLCRTQHTAPPRRFILQGSTRPNIVHDVDPETLGLDDSDWFPLGTYDTTASDWGLDSPSPPTSVTWHVQLTPLRWCTAVRVVMDGLNYAGGQELSACDFRIVGFVRDHAVAATPRSAIAAAAGAVEADRRAHHAATAARRDEDAAAVAARLELARAHHRRRAGVVICLRLCSIIATLICAFFLVLVFSRAM